MFEPGKYLTEADKYARVCGMQEVPEGVIARTKKTGVHGIHVYAKFIKFKETYIDRVRLGVHKYFAKEHEAEIQKLNEKIEIAKENGIKAIQRERESELMSEQELKQYHLDKIDEIKEKQKNAKEKIEQMEAIKQQRDEFKRLMKEEQQGSAVVTEDEDELQNSEESIQDATTTEDTISQGVEEDKQEPIVDKVDIEVSPESSVIEAEQQPAEVSSDKDLIDNEVNRVVEEQAKNTAENVQEVMQEETNNNVLPDWMKEISNATQKMNESLQTIIRGYTTDLTRTMVASMNTKDKEIASEKQKNSSLAENLKNKENEIDGLKASNAEKDTTIEGLKTLNTEKDQKIESLQVSNSEKDKVITKKDAEILELKNQINAMTRQWQQIQAMFANPQNAMSSMNGTSQAEDLNAGKAMTKS